MPRHLAGWLGGAAPLRPSSPTRANIAWIAAGSTSSTRAGCHFGAPSLSTSTDRTPSAKSGMHVHHDARQRQLRRQAPREVLPRATAQQFQRHAQRGRRHPPQDLRLRRRPFGAFGIQRGKDAGDAVLAEATVDRRAMRREGRLGRRRGEARHGIGPFGHQRGAQRGEALARHEMRGQPGMHRIRPGQPRPGQRQPGARPRPAAAAARRRCRHPGTARSPSPASRPARARSR